MSTKISAFTGALALAVVLLVLPAKAQGNAQLVSKFQAVYDSIGKGILSKNADYVLGLLADDYVSVNAKGEAKSHEASVADMKGSIDAVKSGTMQFKVQSVEVVDGGLLVKISLHSEVILNVNNEDHKIVQDETDDDTWVKAGNTLKLAKSVTVTSSGSIDGKPIQ